MAMTITQAEGQAIMQRDRAACLPKFKLSADYAKRLVAAKPAKLPPQVAANLQTALYNGACAAALDGRKEEGIAFLSDALDAGFKEPILETDTDLDPLREMPEFAKLMERFKQVKPTAVASEVESFESFPFDFKITDVEGKPLAKDDLKGKIAIVDIWGTWCPPCRAEIPHFIALQNEYRDKGVEVVGLNHENGDEGEETDKLIREFMKENNMNYRCGIVDVETLQTIPKFEAFPTTLFLDREGKVRMMLVGAQSKEVLESVLKVLLAEDKPAESAGE
jgi:thiol-disulfide isomerase/thioredoxin